MHSHDNFDNENLIKIGKRGHITDQFVELPLEHRIYDMVDSEGQKGLTISEVLINNQQAFSLTFPTLF